MFGKKLNNSPGKGKIKNGASLQNFDMCND